MTLLIALPQLAANLATGVVSAWHVAPGDRLSYGSPICDISVSERLRQPTTNRANRLLKGRSRREVALAPTVERDRFALTYRVIAAENAVVTELAVIPGDLVTPGQTLAIADTGDPTSPGTEASSALPMRVVATIVEPSEP